MPGMECTAVPGSPQVSGREFKVAVRHGVTGSAASLRTKRTKPTAQSRALLERSDSGCSSHSLTRASLKARAPRLERQPGRPLIVAHGSSGVAGHGEQWAEVTGQNSTERKRSSVGSEEAHLSASHFSKPPSLTADVTARRKTTRWPWSRIVLLTSAVLCVATVALLLGPHSAFASSAAAASSTSTGAAGAVGEATIAKLSIGIKVANYLRSHLGWILPDEAIVVLVAALPVVELRGAIPVAFWLGMSAAKAFWLSVFGNMIPVPFILLYLGKVRGFLASKSQKLRNATDWFLEYTRSKAAPIEEFKFLGIMLFVGVPLPGTGAWSGAICSYLLNVSFWEALFANFFGVLIAGGIVCAMCLSGGKKAAFIALNLFLLSGGMWSLVRAGIKVSKAVGHKGTP